MNDLTGTGHPLQVSTPLRAAARARSRQAHEALTDNLVELPAMSPREMAAQRSFHGRVLTDIGRLRGMGLPDLPPR